MLAWIQRSLVIVIVASAAGWWWWSAANGVTHAWRMSVTLLLLLPHAPVLAAEFILLAWFGDPSPAPRPGPRQLLRAWAGEVLCGVKVFGWRQPFRADAEPDHLPAQVQPRQGVLLVHGFVCNRGFWAPWMRRLRALGIPCIAVSLEPVFGSIDAYVAQLEQAFHRLEAATGQAPLIVAHSMGGLAARAWWVKHGHPARCAGLITIGSPHHGTWLARLGFSRNGRQMRQGSAWLAALADAEQNAPPLPIVCYFGHCDNIVFPARTALLQSSESRHLDGVAHVQMAFDERVLGDVVAMLAGSTAPAAPACESQAAVPATAKQRSPGSTVPASMSGSDRKAS